MNEKIIIGMEIVGFKRKCIDCGKYFQPNNNARESCYICRPPRFNQ